MQKTKKVLGLDTKNKFFTKSNISKYWSSNNSHHFWVDILTSIHGYINTFFGISTL